jgi:hypothetical protein
MTPKTKRAKDAGLKTYANTPEPGLAPVRQRQMTRKTKRAKDAGLKAYANTPKPEDAGTRRFAGVS